MFLKNFALVVLKTIISCETFVNDEEEPGDSGIDEQVVYKDGGDVSVPSGVEGGIEGQSWEFEEVFNVWGYDRQQRNIGAGGETEYISVDEQRYKDCVEDQEEGVYDNFNQHSWWFGSRSDAVDQFSHYKTEDKVGKCRGKNNCVLDALGDHNVISVVGAGSF